jgi:CHRD domain
MRRAILVAALGAMLLGALAPGASAQPRTFRAVLSGGDEVPARDTQARGVAKFMLSADGTELQYRIIVANIENVFAAHIHCGPSGVNGPIGVTLFTGSPGGGAINGELESGSVTAPDPGNGCDWDDLDAVIASLESGNAYVNVHTDDGVAPPNTGPGDFPGGEIRGQVF